MYARMYRDVRADVQRSWASTGQRVRADVRRTGEFGRARWVAGEIRFCFFQFVFKFDFAFLKKATCRTYGDYR